MKERGESWELPFNTPSQYYSYKCRLCSHETEIEDVVVDAFFFSQGCKTGEYPKFSCPNCNREQSMIFIKKSAPKVR